MFIQSASRNPAGPRTNADVMRYIHVRYVVRFRVNLIRIHCSLGSASSPYSKDFLVNARFVREARHFATKSLLFGYSGQSEQQRFNSKRAFRVGDLEASHFLTKSSLFGSSRRSEQQRFTVLANERFVWEACHFPAKSLLFGSSGRSEQCRTVRI